MLTSHLPLIAEIYGSDVAGDPLMLMFVAGTAFLLGAVIGSFLNVCISRLPVISIVQQYNSGDDTLRAEIIEALDEDPAKAQAMIDEMRQEKVTISKPRSRCPQCKNQIAWFDNIPIGAWLMLGGKCRHCGLKISPIYPTVELLTGLAFAFLVLKFGLVVGGIYSIIFASLVVITGVDIAIFEIPDEIVLPGIPLGLLATWVLPVTFTEAAIGVLVGGGIPYLVGKGYYLLTKREGMGFGDVKMLAMLGAFFGWKGVIAILLLASFVGATIGLTLVVLRRHESRAMLPFGPFLALGAVVFMVAGPELVNWYLGMGG
ncbi:prepilin peptidase [bacterium]|nr:prepilin peptidase [bacterium]